MMRSAMVAAFVLSSAGTAYAQSEDSCKIEDGMSICQVAERMCLSFEDVPTPRHLGEYFSGRILHSDGIWVVIQVEANDSFRNMAFLADMESREVCLKIVGTPLKQGTAL